jgi:hypothetical protein
MPSTRILSLGALCVNYTVLTIAMHISRARADPSLPRYKASSAVVLTEVGKLLVSLYLGLAEVKRADDRSQWDQGSAASPSTVLHGLGFAQAEQSPKTPPAKVDRAGSPVFFRPGSSGRGAATTKASSDARDKARADGGSHARTASVDLPQRRFSVGESANDALLSPQQRSEASEPRHDGLVYRFRRLGQEVFAGDWWKLGLPAGLFTLQSNLQYTAVANLSVPAFQVTSQLKVRGRACRRSIC